MEKQFAGKIALVTGAGSGFAKLYLRLVNPTAAPLDSRALSEVSDAE